MTINITTTILENINTVAQSIIALCSIFALNLIRIAKTDILTRSQREAATSALQKIEEFKKILVLYLEFNKTLHEHNIQAYNEECGDFVATSKVLRWGGVSNNKCMNAAIRLANDLECFSAYFMHRVADEEIAFTPTSIEFCAAVKSIYPYISSMRDSETHNLYKNVIQLYQIWFKRIKNENIKKQMVTLSKELETNTPKINPPIGTK
ncbi:MAG TPA: hypothetical protein VLK22_01230 [Candidatus Udaeobacter sp.]|nr:hypothetical protein [Candidatus Udaeobacter sp.]